MTQSPVSVGTVYQLVRLIDDGVIVDSGKQKVWPPIGHPYQERQTVCPVYGGTITLATPLQILDVNAAEMDMRVLIEMGEIPVFGQYPSFTGIQIMHKMEAEAYLQSNAYPGKSPDNKDPFPYQTLIVIRYCSGVIQATVEDMQARLLGLRQMLENPDAVQVTG